MRGLEQKNYGAWRGWPTEYGNWWIKGNDEFTLVTNSSAPLMQYNLNEGVGC